MRYHTRVSHLIDLAERRPRPPEHKCRAKADFESPVHEEPAKYPIGRVAVLRHADEG